MNAVVDYRWAAADQHLCAPIHNCGRHEWWMCVCVRARAGFVAFSRNIFMHNVVDYVERARQHIMHENLRWI